MESFRNSQWIHSGRFSWQQSFAVESFDQSLSYSSRFTDVSHSLTLSHTDGFPVYRNVLVNNDFLRQIDFTNSWKPVIELNQTQMDDSSENDIHMAIVNWKSLAEKTMGASNPHAISDLSAISWRFLLWQYSERFKFSEDFIADVIEAGERIDNRVITIMSFLNNFSIAELFESQDYDPEQLLELNGVFSMITSEDESEPMFFEMMERIVFKRLNPEASEDEISEHIKETFSFIREPGTKYVEMGRLAVLKEYNPIIAPLLIQYLVSAAKGSGADQIIVYADKLHKRMYAEYGFDVHSERVDQEGNTFYVLMQKPDIVLGKALTLFYRATTDDIRSTSPNDLLEGKRPTKPPNDIRFDPTQMMSYASSLKDKISLDVLKFTVNQERQKQGLPPLPGTRFFTDLVEEAAEKDPSVIDKINDLIDRLKR